MWVTGGGERKEEGVGRRGEGARGSHQEGGVGGETAHPSPLQRFAGLFCVNALFFPVNLCQPPTTITKVQRCRETGTFNP